MATTKEKTNKQKKTTTLKKKEAEPKGNGQTIAIIILSGVLVFSLITFTVLALTGVIKFGSGGDDTVAEKTEDGSDKSDDRKKDDRDSDDEPVSGTIIENPYVQAVEDDETLVHVGDLEFYLPDEFTYGGKNKEGVTTYNLTDDDGWAQVLVYAEYTSLSPSAYINKISSSLDITNRNRWIKGASWVQAENANCLAYATELDGKVYAVYLAVKLDSDATAEAMKMIPRTLYMKKIVKE